MNDKVKKVLSELTPEQRNTIYNLIEERLKAAAQQWCGWNKQKVDKATEFVKEYDLMWKEISGLEG